MLVAGRGLVGVFEMPLVSGERALAEREGLRESAWLGPLPARRANGSFPKSSHSLLLLLLLPLPLLVCDPLDWLESVLERRRRPRAESVSVTEMATPALGRSLSGWPRPEVAAFHWLPDGPVWTASN